MSAWRAAGLNYMNFSVIAARTLRKALKSQFRAEAEKRNVSHVKFTSYADGKPQKITNPLETNQ